MLRDRWLLSDVQGLVAFSTLFPLHWAHGLGWENFLAAGSLGEAPSLPSHHCHLRRLERWGGHRGQLQAEVS